MENNFSLVISELAFEDLDNYSKYISVNLSNPVAAKKFIRDIKEVLNNICLFPYSCPLLDNEFVRESEIRKLIVNKFIVLYKIDNNIIKVIRIVHSTSNYQNLI